MSLNKKLLLKVCGLNDLNSVEHLIPICPDFIGFIFYPKSPRNITLMPEDLVNIPSSIKKIGVFVNSAISEIADNVYKYGLQGVQLHGNENVAFIKELKKTIPNQLIIKSVGIEDTFDFEKIESFSSLVDYFLFDTKSAQYGGTGIKFNWNKLSQYHGVTPFFLSGGIGLEDIEELNQLNIKTLIGIDINSRFEIVPGVKNTANIQKFRNQLI